jgi:hypothetical protein
MEDKTTLSSQSWLPVQAAPVDRKPGSAALAGGSGVEAAGLLSGIIPGWDVIKGPAGDIGSTLWSWL